MDSFLLEAYRKVQSRMAMLPMTSQVPNSKFQNFLNQQRPGKTPLGEPTAALPDP